MPRSCRCCPPPGPRLCGLCELRYGPWGVALLLLHLLLLLTGGKENLAVCHQHKHRCCCCRRRLFLPPAAFAAAVVAALPSWWPCCSGCCSSCAHRPCVSFSKGSCVEKHKLLFHLLSFQAKGIALKTHKVLLPCSRANKGKRALKTKEARHVAQCIP